MHYDLRSLARIRNEDVGAVVARNDSTVCAISGSTLPQRIADAELTNTTACALFSGIVATMRARRGISVCVDCDNVENVTSTVR